MRHEFLLAGRDADGGYSGTYGAHAVRVRKDRRAWVAHSGSYESGPQATRKGALEALGMAIDKGCEPPPAILRIYRGSDATATEELFEVLRQCGLDGMIAIELFVACKSSEWAKSARLPSDLQHLFTYATRARGAYELKGRALSNVCQLLPNSRWPWGWSHDGYYPRRNGFVLYIDLPTGQVSFHAGERGSGPSYPKCWDGVRDASPDRVCLWISQLMGACRGIAA